MCQSREHDLHFHLLANGNVRCGAKYILQVSGKVGKSRQLEQITLLSAKVPNTEKKTHLVVPSMLVQERDDGFNVVLLDNVQDLRAFD